MITELTRVFETGLRENDLPHICSFKGPKQALGAAGILLWDSVARNSWIKLAISAQLCRVIVNLLPAVTAISELDIKPVGGLKGRAEGRPASYVSIV